jgi:hypothetical protein
MTPSAPPPPRIAVVGSIYVEVRKKKVEPK